MSQVGVVLENHYKAVNSLWCWKRKESLSGAKENIQKEMAKHFLRVEIGDADAFTIGGSEMTAS